jgi:hypothetical protein
MQIRNSLCVNFLFDDRWPGAGCSAQAKESSRRRQQAAAEGTWLLQSSLGNAVKGGGVDAVAQAVSAAACDCECLFDISRADVKSLLCRAAASQVLQGGSCTGLRAVLLASVRD